MSVSGVFRSNGRRNILSIILFVGLLGGLVGASACMSKREKARKLLERRLEECRKGSGTWHEVSVLDGRETDRILRETCSEKMGTIEMPDRSSATVEIGPYTWEAGIDQDMGAWILQDVSWKPLDRGLSRLDKQSPSEKELERGVKYLADAQKAYPKSSLVRLKRLEGLIEIREQNRADKKESAIELGERAGGYFEELVKWAQDNDDATTASRARLQAVRYVKDYIRFLKDAKNTLGSQDDYYKKSAEEAEKAGNDEQAEKYRTKLEELKEERPKKREKYNSLLSDARRTLCEHLSELDPSSIDNKTVRKQAESAKSGTNCDDLPEPDEDDDGED